MTIQPTYPGVYVEEIPSGVRTIAGVPTSVAAFVGRARRGPTNQPTVINSYGDFERTFGGLWLQSSVSYALRDYFLNGGGQAILVRLFSPELYQTSNDKTASASSLQSLETQLRGLPDPTASETLLSQVRAAAAAAVRAITAEPLLSIITQAARAAEAAAAVPNATKTTVADAVQQLRVNAKPATALLRLPTAFTSGAPALVLSAASPGQWGNSLRARVDFNVPSGAAERFGVSDPNSLFNLTVRDLSTGTTEVFRNVTVVAGTRQVDRVLQNESTLVRVHGNPPNTRPVATDTALTQSTKPDGLSVIDGQALFGVLTADEASDGRTLSAATFTGAGLEGRKEGLFALERTDIFNLLCIPPHELDGNIEDDLITTATAYCERRRAMLIVDPPTQWNSKDAARDRFSDVTTRSRNATLFFPRLVQRNPLHDNQFETFAPCGAVAGVIARTDAQRGIFKAPAGLDAALAGVPQLAVSLTDAENGELNPLGINCLRTLPAAGRVVWGARTLQGDDRLASEWKYLPVRRLALFIEESLYRGTQWVVFEANDEPLWSQIRLNVGAFMNNLFRQGAFQGQTPREAYLVKCDRETTTQTDINLGVVNILVGFAPLKPAEFVFIKLQQLAGQISS